MFSGSYTTVNVGDPYDLSYTFTLHSKRKSFSAVAVILRTTYVDLVRGKRRYLRPGHPTLGVVRGVPRKRSSSLWHWALWARSSCLGEEAPWFRSSELLGGCLIRINYAHMNVPMKRFQNGSFSVTPPPPRG